jgi:hypothetical protein
MVDIEPLRSECPRRFTPQQLRLFNRLAARDRIKLPTTPTTQVASIPRQLVSSRKAGCLQ